MERTPLEKDNEAGARALKATSVLLTKLGEARKAFEAVKKDYWVSYWLVYNRALLDMENEDERD
jgi:hypothetical protein